MTRSTKTRWFGHRTRSWVGVLGLLGMVGGLTAAGLPLRADAEPARSAVRPAVAAPGPCAEPRDAADRRAAADFDVAGPAAALFDPIDVAAGPEGGLSGADGLAGRRPPPPEARALVRPGACDQPGSGCTAAIASRPTVVVPPVVPGTGPPQGAP